MTATEHVGAPQGWHPPMPPSVVDPKAGLRSIDHVPTPPTPDPPTPPDEPVPPPIPDHALPVTIDRLIGCPMDVTTRESGFVTAVVVNSRATHVVGVDVDLGGRTTFVPWVFLAGREGHLETTVPAEDGLAGLAAILEHGSRILRSGGEMSNIRIERDGRVHVSTGTPHGGGSEDDPDCP